MRHIIRIAASLLLFGAIFSAPLAVAQQATFLTVAVSPSSGSLSAGAPKVLSLVWNVNRQDDGNGGCGMTVTSGSGALRADSPSGQVIHTVPLALTQTLPCSGTPGGIVPFTFPETLTVPASVTQRAQRLGVGRIFYVRSFDDGRGPDSASVALDLTSSAIGALSITRQALSFESGAPAAVVGRNEPLTAVTELNFNSTGLLQAQWEIAGPESTAGTPVFRPISQVRQYLAGGSAQVLRSPGLPTATTGLYFVRLRITDPEPGFEPPVIRYFVLQRRPDEQPPGSTLSLGAPAPRTLFASDTVFAWQAIPGARAYQLEVYQGRQQPGLALPDLRSRLDEPTPGEVADALSRPPVTGALVQGAQTRTVLSPMARRHLLPGRSYFWRVLAIGDDGAVIGVSPLRELRTP